MDLLISDPETVADQFSSSCIYWLFGNVDFSVRIRAGDLLRDKTPSLTEGSGHGGATIEYYVQKHWMAIRRSIMNPNVIVKTAIFHSFFLPQINLPLPTDPHDRLRTLNHLYRVPGNDPWQIARNNRPTMSVPTNGGRLELFSTRYYRALFFTGDNFERFDACVFPGELLQKKMIDHGIMVR